jgi:hypothetical protein
MSRKNTWRVCTNSLSMNCAAGILKISLRLLYRLTQRGR